MAKETGDYPPVDKVTCSVDAGLSGSRHTNDDDRADWRIVVDGGAVTFHSCDAHLASLCYFNAPNKVTHLGPLSAREPDRG